MNLTIQGFTEPTSLRSGATLAPMIGIIYGIFVEIDDGASADASKRSSGSLESAGAAPAAVATSRIALASVSARL